MKKYIISKSYLGKVFFLIGLISLSQLFTSCNESFLDEVPLDRFSPENLLVDEAGFNTAVVSLYQAAREEHAIGGVNFDYMNLGTDIVEWGRPDSRGFKDYTLLNSQFDPVVGYWDWAYKSMIRQCNFILDNINKPEVKIEESQRAYIAAQAKFFRGYTYNVLAVLYGGVPIVDFQITEPKFDYQRATKEEVLRFVVNDLEEAAVDLPAVENVSDGRIYKAAAYHLLAEVYISLAMETGDVSFYDKSIAAANKVINGESGQYQLMTERFGDLSRPGDVFSDLFWGNQQNRASGNLEVIFAWQFESFTLGGGIGNGEGNINPRWWAPEQDRIRTPNGVINLRSDSLQRGIGVNSPTNYFKYDVWKLDSNDMRNSKYNIRREFYYNNPEDTEYFGKKILSGRDSNGKLVVALEDGTLTTQILDTLRMYYPWIRKIDGIPFNDDPVSGRSGNDVIRIRLAETYLLRAEAFLRKGDLQSAADDINILRNRAAAVPVSSGEIDIDFLLDERARELIVEEPRRRTLQRMGLLYERVKKYNPPSANSIQPYNELWPIPQKFIDSNTGAAIQQNPGYPQ